MDQMSTSIAEHHLKQIEAVQVDDFGEIEITAGLAHTLNHAAELTAQEIAPATN